MVLSAFVVQAYFSMLEFWATFLERLSDSKSTVHKSAIMNIIDINVCLILKSIQLLSVLLFLSTQATLFKKKDFIHLF